MSKKRILSINFSLVIMFCLLLSLSAGASANTVGGFNNTGGGSATGGSGGGGTVTWYNLHNTDSAKNLSYRGVAATVEALRKNVTNPELTGPRHRGEAVTRDEFKAVLPKIFSGCAAALFTQNADAYLTRYPVAGQCPIWWNSRHKTGFNDSLTWYNLHSFYPNKAQDPIANTVAAFNVRIWRENRNKDRMELIFARQLGINGVTENRNDTVGIDVNKRWWYGGNSTNANGKNGIGGRFTLSGRTFAGPVGNFEGNERANCIRNWQRGQNGLRNNLGRRSANNRVSQYVRPISPPSGNFCYWEGDDIGDNPFRWNKHNKELANDINRFSRLDARGASNDAINTQFGRPINNGAYAAGLKEAIRIKWDLPTGIGQEPEIDIKLEFAPGLFYAVQVLAVDGREHIMPINVKPERKNNLNYNGFINRRQLLEGYLVGVAIPEQTMTCLARRNQIRSNNPGFTPQQLDRRLEALGYSENSNPECFTDPDPGCENPPCVEEPPPFEGPTPIVNVDLTAESPIQTRQPTEQKINIDVDYDEKQAVFPYLSELIHYTPQLRFSSPVGGSAIPNDQLDNEDYNNPQYNPAGTYNYNYISYDDGATGIERQPADDFLSGPNSSPGRAAFNAQEVELQRGIELQRNADGSFNNGADSLTSVDYGMTWLQPTLNNPCASEVPAVSEVREENYNWPNTPRNCPTNADNVPKVVNAWDDLLRAQAWWEERWMNGKRGISDPFLVDTIYNENLRCADTVTNPDDDPDGGKKVEDCDHPSYGFFSNVDNITEQHAQGYINIVNDADKPTYAYVTLRTNRPNRVTSANITRRDDGTTAFPNHILGKGPHGLINTITDHPQLSYCLQGIQGPIFGGGEAAKVKLPIPGEPDRVLDRALGDPLCGGYDSRWRWPQSGDTGYTESCNARPNKRWPHLTGNRYLPPPTGQNWPGVPVKPAGYNGYSGYYREGNGDSRDGLAQAYDPNEFIGSPYVGRRPGGNASTGNYKVCTELQPARYTKGAWHRNFGFRLIGQSRNNCVYRYQQILQLKNRKPNNSSVEGYGQPCNAFRFANGARKWRFGFWYPTRAVWVWDKNSAEFGITNDRNGQEKTEIGPGQPKRGQGQWWESPPTHGEITGTNLGVGGNFVIYTGRRNHNPGSINDFFDDSLWVKMKPKNGYLTSGQWVLNRGPEEGWGRNNSGYRLDPSGYVPEFTFQWPDIDTAEEELKYSTNGYAPYKYPRAGETCPAFAYNQLYPGTCWSMQATYRGYNNIQWRFAQGTNDSWEDSAYIKVYGPRNAR